MSVIQNKEVILTLIYNTDTQYKFLWGGIALILTGIGLLILGDDTFLKFLGVVAIIYGLVNIHHYSRKIFLLENEIIVRTWLFQKTLPLHINTKMYQAAISENQENDSSNSSNKLVIETNHRSIHIFIDRWENYDIFKKTLEKRLSTSHSMNTYQKGKVKVIRTDRSKPPVPMKQFLTEQTSTQQPNVNYKMVGIGFGIFVSLIGLIAFFRKIYTMNGTNLNISSEPFLMAVGVAIAIYFAMFSKGGE